MTQQLIYSVPKLYYTVLLDEFMDFQQVVLRYFISEILFSMLYFSLQDTQTLNTDTFYFCR